MEKSVTPTPYFLSLLNHYSWFPVHIPTVKKHGPLDKQGNRWTLPGNFVGNGPFVLDKWEINKVIVVKKSPTYWDRKTVKLEEIHFHPISDVEVEERTFRAGQIHVSNTIPLNKIEVYRKKDPKKLRIDTYLGTYFYRLNTKRKIVHGADRERGCRGSLRPQKESWPSASSLKAARAGAGAAGPGRSASMTTRRTSTTTPGKMLHYNSRRGC